jgi:hypothetical protein
VNLDAAVDLLDRLHRAQNKLYAGRGLFLVVACLPTRPAEAPWREDDDQEVAPSTDPARFIGRRTCGPGSELEVECESVVAMINSLRWG